MLLRIRALLRRVYVRQAYEFQQIDSCDRSIFLILLYNFLFPFYFFLFLFLLISFIHFYVSACSTITRSSSTPTISSRFLRKFSFFSPLPLTLRFTSYLLHRTTYACCFIEFNATIFVVFHDNAQYPEYVSLFSFFFAGCFSSVCIENDTKNWQKHLCAPFGTWWRYFRCSSGHIGHTKKKNLSTEKTIWRAFVSFLCMRFIRNGHKREIFVSFFFFDVRLASFDSTGWFMAEGASASSLHIQFSHFSTTFE